MQQVRTLQRPRPFSNPRPLVALFDRPVTGYAWFFLRLYIGWQWLTAGWSKVHGPTSVGWIHAGHAGGKAAPAGSRLLAFWQHAVAPPQSGMPQIGLPWYRDFLQALIAHHAERWFVYLIAFGEFLVGLALILGALTAVAAACGALLNFNYMLAGSASLNPVLFFGALLLILAWRVSGYLGLDRWLLPLLGTPWQPGRLFQRAQQHVVVGNAPLRDGKGRLVPPLRRRSGPLRRRRYLA